MGDSTYSYKIFTDPDTFCRDENCPMPQVGHDVAHGATILQEISGAKPNQQQLGEPKSSKLFLGLKALVLMSPENPDIHNFQSPDVSTSSYSYTPQIMEQSYPFSLEYSSPYLADNVVSFGSPHDGQQSHDGTSQPSQNYPETFDPSQGVNPPQTTSFQNSTQYAPTHSQSYTGMQELPSAGTPSVFPLDAYGPTHTFGDAFIQAHSQQTHWTYQQSPINTNLAGPPQMAWTTNSEPLTGFNFNSPLNGQIVDPSYGQHSLNGDLSSGNSLVFRPVSGGQTTPSRSIESATATPSPGPKLAADVLHGIHRCQWRLDEDRLCEEQFKDSRELHDHIATTHVETLQTDGHDGFMCRWAGCSRQTDEKHENKRGFTARSKLKRHLIIHTGPGKL